jgi:hypothetical protein
VIAALAAAAVCAATPVHAAPYPHVESGLSQLKWVQAGPKRGRITGFLFGYDPRLVDAHAPAFSLWTNGTAPEGWATKVLWRVPLGRGDRELVIRGRSLDDGGTFEQRSVRAGGGAGYPSIVTLPSAGCWRLEVRTGGVKASFVVKAVAP